MLRRALAPFILALTASCSGFLPSTSVPWHNARSHFAIDDSAPLVAVERERHIQPPNLGATTPVLEQLAAEIAKSDIDGDLRGVTYDLTKGNALAKNWIVQTPDRWGVKASELGAGRSDGLPLRIRDLVARARQRVDISMLQPPADGAFLDALRDALQTLASSGRAVTVRIAIGQYPPTNVDAAAFLKKLAPEAPSKLKISVAAMRSCVAWDDCDSYSWNHSKIVAVDGIEAMVGGHNMWSKDYLLGEPVHDLSMMVRGPAAASAARFTDELWRFICANVDKKAAISVVGNGADACAVPPPLLPKASGAGGLPVLAVGRLGAGITKQFANQSELARDLMFGAAEHNIRIVQQDIGFTLGRADVLYPESTLARLVTFLLRRQGDVYIVLSNQGATGNSGSSYSNDVSLADFARHLRDLTQRRIEAQDPKERYEIHKGPDPINALLCEHVHLAPFRFGPDDKWPNGAAIGTHAKFWMVDDRTYYIGSDNLYPVNLQEFGYVLDDRKAAKELIDGYWAPLWQWSERAAVSGAGVKECIFRQPSKQK